MQGISPAPVVPVPTPKSVRFRHSFWWYLKWFFISLQLVLFCAIVISLCILKGVYDELSAIVPDVRFMEARNKSEATRIYSGADKAGKRVLLAEIKGEQRDWTPLSALFVTRQRNSKMKREPGHLINATIAVEDARFYTHPGMDAKRILGAAKANFEAGGASQGGSTITEQLAKNVYLTRTKTLSRRLQTALLALQLERKFTKDEILELYLNEIYYGNRVYGCEAAAQTYFGKPAVELNIAQAALVAGLPQRPEGLDPFEHFDRAKRRQRVVLREMLQNRKINYTQYLDAVKDASLEGTLKKQRIKLIEQRNKGNKGWQSPYFVSYVKQYLAKQGISEDQVNKGGYKIYTTIDMKMQAEAQRVLIRQLERLPNRRGNYLQGALVCLDPWSGQVLAMVGGRDYYDTRHNGEFNRAVMARRQPGSTFKPYVYAAAMEAGYTPNSIVIDEPLRLCGDQACGPANYRGRRRRSKVGHEIKNYDFAHRGAIPFQTAIAISNNVAATKVLLRLGVQTVIEKAHLMGIQSSLPPYPSLALGAGEITLLEHTSAFGVFATKGLRVEPTPIERVENYSGQVLIEQQHPAIGARVLSEQAGNEMFQMLRYTVTNGTGKPANIPGEKCIGKTGTTTDNKDVWFMGATPQLATGVWIGYDKPQDLGYRSAGGRWCGPVWREYMERALKLYRDRNPVERAIENARMTEQQKRMAEQFKKIVNARICTESGLLATSECPNTVIKSYSSASGDAGGGPPQQYCDIHRSTAGSAPSLGGQNAAPQPGDLGYEAPTTVPGDVPAPPNTDAFENPQAALRERPDAAREVPDAPQEAPNGDDPNLARRARPNDGSTRQQDSQGHSFDPNDGVVILDENERLPTGDR